MSDVPSDVTGDGVSDGSDGVSDGRDGVSDEIGDEIGDGPSDGASDETVVRLERWAGPWPADDKDANFKSDVALYSTADPLRTIRVLSESTGVPVGAIVRYVLARWASEGASGLLELGPTMSRRLHAVCAAADEIGTDAARLDAYATLRQMLSWLVYPLDHPEVYDDPSGPDVSGRVGDGDLGDRGRLDGSDRVGDRDLDEGPGGG